MKADPTAKFIAYPAWYFLALYGLLRVAGQAPAAILPIANLLATVVVPGVLVLILILLPWLDRNPSRQISRRPWILGSTAVVVVFAVALSVYSQLAIQQEQVENPAPAPAAAAAATTGGASSAAATAGAKTYAQSCQGCHQPTGAGMPGTFPPLAANTYVTGDPKAVIHTVLYGLNGAIQVGGKPYSGVMPPWKAQLSNADVANVVTYIRTAWGNKASEVTETDVAKVTK
jgi:mono/diheme cytochrome c family protein